MNLNVVHGNGGQVQPELRPVRAAIPGDPQSEFGSREKEVVVFRMLPDDVDRPGGPGDTATDVFPRLAVVGGQIYIHVVVVAAMPVERCVGRALASFGSH